MQTYNSNNTAKGAAILEILSKKPYVYINACNRPEHSSSACQCCDYSRNALQMSVRKATRGTGKDHEAFSQRENARDAATDSEIRSKTKIAFATANVYGVGISLMAALASNAAFDRLDNLRKIGETGITYASQLHWLIFFSAAIVLYVVASFLVELKGANGFFTYAFRIPAWTELRSFGNHQIAKISYVALVTIPFAVSFIIENPLKMELLNNTQIPLNLKIAFFISFFLSMALIIFIVGCPKEYLPKKSVFEGSKNINMVFGNASKSVVSVKQDDSEFVNEALDGSKLFLRFLCWTFYSLGLAYATVLLFRSARLVLFS